MKIYKESVDYFIKNSIRSYGDKNYKQSKTGTD